MAGLGGAPVLTLIGAQSKAPLSLWPCDNLFALAVAHRNCVEFEKTVRSKDQTEMLLKVGLGPKASLSKLGPRVPSLKGPVGHYYNYYNWVPGFP